LLPYFLPKYMLHRGWIYEDNHGRGSRGSVKCQQERTSRSLHSYSRDHETLRMSES
jgi:hypothetical protein